MSRRTYETPERFCPGSGTFIPQDGVTIDGKTWQETDGTEEGPVKGFCVECETDFELVEEVAHGWHLPDHPPPFAR